MGGKSQTVRQESAPWRPAQGYLTGAMGEAQNLYNQGAFAPVPYGFGGSTSGGGTSTQPAQPAPTGGTGAGTGATGSGFGGMPWLTNFLNGMMGRSPGMPSGAIGANRPAMGYGPGTGGAPAAGTTGGTGGTGMTGGMGGTDLEAAARRAAEMRIPGFGDTTQGAMQSILDRAGAGAPGLESARSFLTSMMGGGQYAGMQGVRDNILGSALPAATSMFSGSGLTNSSVAMDGVGRAATEALAPFEYGAWENAQNRGMQAAGMMPGMEQAMYMPAQMQLGVGQMQDQLAQQRATMAHQAYNEAAGRPAANFSPYLNAIMGLGGMGGSASETSPVDGTGLGPGIVGGLGMYGTLAGAGLSGGMAGAGGLLAGLAALSDRRAKEDITRIGTTDGGRALYKYRYKGAPGFHIGVMAQENPDMIAGYTDTGLAMVDYGRIN